MANKIIGIIAVVALVLSGFTAIKLYVPTSVSHSLGSLAGMSAENYIPFIRLNGGYNSALPIQTSNTFSSASSTVSGSLSLTKPTLCVNFYATSTATQLHLTASTTGTLPGLAAAVMTADYGACS